MNVACVSVCVVFVGHLHLRFLQRRNEITFLNEKKKRNKQKIKIPFSECRIPIFERLVHGSWFAYTLNENYKIWLTVRYFHFDFKISVSKICDDVCVACDNQGVIDRKGLEFQTDGMIINNRTENE